MQSLKRKPLVVVTRRLPEVVETRMRELFEIRLNPDDKPLAQEAPAAAPREADVPVPTVTDETGYHIRRADMVEDVGAFERDGLTANAIQLDGNGIAARRTASGGWAWVDAE